jgi:uncharacterized membrane protein
MAMRLHEVHPAIVHFPIALLPVALGADLLGRLTGSETLKDIGRIAMPLTAAGAAASALSGLIAQEEVVAEGEAHDILVTHRNMNISLVGVVTAMAAGRMGRKEASAGYLALGAAALGAVSYSAYLGSKMVYDHGVGVLEAGGVRADATPELTPGTAKAFAGGAVRDVARGVPHVVDEIRSGEIAPNLGAGRTGAAANEAGRDDRLPEGIPDY